MVAFCVIIFLGRTRLTSSTPSISIWFRRWLIDVWVLLFGFILVWLKIVEGEWTSIELDKAKTFHHLPSSLRSSFSKLFEGWLLRGVCVVAWCILYHRTVKVGYEQVDGEYYLLNKACQKVDLTWKFICCPLIVHIGSAWFDGVEMDGIEVGVGGVMGGATNGRFEFVMVR